MILPQFYISPCKLAALKQPAGFRLAGWFAGLGWLHGAEALWGSLLVLWAPGWLQAGLAPGLAWLGWHRTSCLNTFYTILAILDNILQY